MVTNLDQFTFRQFSVDDDIPRIIRLRDEIESVDQEGTVTSGEALRAQLDLPGHDPSKDRWVIEDSDDPERLLGYGLTWVTPPTETAEINILVHPGWRRQGLGTALLTRILQRSRDMKAAQAHSYANENHPAASSFLLKHGFESNGAYTEMSAPADLRMPQPIWPFGYQLRTYAEVQDLAVVIEAMNQCYLGLWGHHEVSEQQMSSWLPEFNPEGLFLVFSERGRVVGISRCGPDAERSERNGIPTGYIDSPGIAPQHRRDDLYRCLLITGVRWLQSQGMARIELGSWGDRPTTLRLYHELGFTVKRRLNSYTIKL